MGTGRSWPVLGDRQSPRAPTGRNWSPGYPLARFLLAMPQADPGRSSAGLGVRGGSGLSWEVSQRVWGLQGAAKGRAPRGKRSGWGSQGCPGRPRGGAGEGRGREGWGEAAGVLGTGSAGAHAGSEYLGALWMWGSLTQGLGAGSQDFCARGPRTRGDSGWRQPVRVPESGEGLGFSGPRFRAQPQAEGRGGPAHL